MTFLASWNLGWWCADTNQCFVFFCHYHVARLLDFCPWFCGIENVDLLIYIMCLMSYAVLIWYFFKANIFMQLMYVSSNHQITSIKQKLFASAFVHLIFQMNVLKLPLFIFIVFTIFLIQTFTDHIKMATWCPRA